MICFDPCLQQAGGPLYDIELGRRDGLTSYAPSSETFLPAFNLNVSGLLEDFELVGLDLVDLIVLSGGSYCTSSTLSLSLTQLASCIL